MAPFDTVNGRRIQLGSAIVQGSAIDDMRSGWIGRFELHHEIADILFSPISFLHQHRPFVPLLCTFLDPTLYWTTVVLCDLAALPDASFTTSTVYFLKSYHVLAVLAVKMVVHHYCVPGWTRVWRFEAFRCARALPSMAVCMTM